ncbi:MAG: hypothetical protein ACPGVI_03945 [Crocinitomicaceae bacterium]
MKKVILIAAVSIVGLASCSKNRTCQCEVHSYGGPHITHHVLKGTKSNTKVECDAIKVNLQATTNDYVECGIQ